MKIADKLLGLDPAAVDSNPEIYESFRLGVLWTKVGHTAIFGGAIAYDVLSHNYGGGLALAGSAVAFMNSSLSVLQIHKLC